MTSPRWPGKGSGRVRLGFEVSKETKKRYGGRDSKAVGRDTAEAEVESSLGEIMGEEVRYMEGRF